MSTTRASRLRLLVGLVTIPLVLLPAAAATASHNRASTGDFSITGGYATWTVDTVWRSFDSGSLVGETVGDTIGVYELSSASDAPDSGVYTGVDLELSSYVDDFSNPLFGVATETIEGDVSSLEDGIYEVYAETCCRVGPENGDGNFSQWVRFTKTAGVYNVAPVFNNAPLFDWLPEAGNLVLDYTATDPEAGAVTYELVTDIDYPYWGATELPCSTFTGGILTVGSSLCAPGDTYGDIFALGTFWAVKVSATDSAGNQSVTDTMLRRATTPEPYIDDYEVVGNGTTYDFYVYANDTPIPTSWVVECVGINEPTDVVTGTGTASPVRVYGLTVGEEYTCEVTATNSVGSGTSTNGNTYGPIELDGVAIDIDLAVGDKLAGTEVALLGANLLADSAYNLVQHSTPLTLASGTADGDGTFLRTLALPSSACVAGVHSLVLTGVGTDSTPRTDTVWYELDTNCVVLQVSRAGAVTATPAALAMTGSAFGPVGTGAGLAALVLGFGLLFVTRGRRTRRQS